jgi:hypothetical protein
MGKLNSKLMNGLVASVAVWATACSQAVFNPSNLSDSGTLGSSSGGETTKAQEQETFAFDGDTTKAKVDILFVIDNSGSMRNKQEKLAPRLSTFVDSLGNIDWQIGITTTDASHGKFGLKGALSPLTGFAGNILTPKVPNYEQVFANSVIRSESLNCGTSCPADDERPLYAFVGAMSKRNTANAGFFRDGASLALVVLSDEDESYTQDPYPVTPQEAMDAKNALFPEKAFTSYGIVIKPNDATCLAEQTPTGGKVGRYTAELARLSGGVTGSICDTDYSASLAAIGKGVRENSQRITLKYSPIPESLKLEISPFDPELQYEIQGRSIRFNKAPKKGTSVKVLYFRD